MIRNDKVKGTPLVQYKDTKTNIEALSGIEEGAIAYATNTNEFGSYDGTTWTWGQSGSFDLAAAIHAATEDTSLSNDDELGIWESVSGLLRKIKWSTIVSGLGAYFVSHSSSTAANDFLVGSGTGAWIKKTLAQTVTILQSSLDSIYAAITHTHSGSDITSGTVAAARLPETAFSQILFFHGAGGTIAAGGTSYMYPGREGLLTLGGNAFPKSGKIKNLYFKTNSAQPGTGSLVCTVQKNLVDSTCVATVAAGSAATQASDTTHTITFSAGDVFTIAIKNNASSASATITYVSAEFVFD